jgi:hypothetical protein
LQFGSGVAPCERQRRAAAFLERAQDRCPLMPWHVPAGLAYGGGKFSYDLGRAGGDLPVQLVRHAGEYHADLGLDGG